MANKTDYKRIKRRVWEVQSQCYHEDKAIWTPEIVTRVIEQLESEKLSNGKPALKRWAWCMHDKDPVREENIDQLRLINPLQVYHIGDDRPAHIHLALEFENAVFNSHLQKITQLPIEFIRKPEAKYMQFMAIATYLSHCRAEEQAKGKHLYPAEEIHCNFNYTEEVRAYLAKKDRYLSQVRKSPRQLADTIINRIESEGLTVEEAKDLVKDAEGFAYFLRYEKEFRAARTEFIKRHYEMKPRINYYIYGAAGSGKSTMSKHLAKALFPDLQDFECYYTAGAAGVRFDDYEYQPVIIWEDIRAEDLLREYKREGILNLMELSPKKRSYNIKYGKVTLTHQVNIFTGPDPFEEFAAKLMGAYSEGGKVVEGEKDTEQAYRRFPVIINVLKNENEVVVYANDRIFGDAKTSEFKKFARAMNVNIAKLNQSFAGPALDEAFKKITSPAVKLHNDFLELMSGNKYTAEDDATTIIEVVEGYQDVEESDGNEFEQYLNWCKRFLDSCCLEDGSFGPYISQAGWKLGDELDGEYEGAFCPIEFQQWKGMGRPSDLSEGGDYDDIFRVGSEPVEDYYLLEKRASEFNQNVQFALDENARLLELLPLIHEYKESVSRGENPDLPEGVSEQDLLDSEWVVPDEAVEAAMMIPDEDLKEPLPEWFEEYSERLTSVKERFMQSKTVDDLGLWVHTLFDHPEDETWILSDAWTFMLSNWYEVKSACAEFGLAEDEKSWYKLYQELNVNE